MGVDAVEAEPSVSAEEAVLIGNVLESSTEYSIIATDADGVIVLWNEGARRLHGYEPSEILGQPISRLHRQQDVLAGVTGEMMERALADGKWEGRLERVHKDGTTLIARIVMTPRRGKDEQPIGFLMMGRDITDSSPLPMRW
jgi:PAS domain S-box-containing protein